MLFERKTKATGGGIGGQLSKVFYSDFFFGDFNGAKDQGYRRGHRRTIFKRPLYSFFFGDVNGAKDQGYYWRGHRQKILKCPLGFRV